MRNLVLGSSGFVGKYLCKYLQNLNEEVVEFDVRNDLNQDCRSFQFNLENIDRVYILAWDVGGAKYLYNNDNQLSQLLWNIKLLENLIPQFKNIPFVFASSQLADNCDLVYGVTKRMGEVWVKNSSNGNAIRLWNVYGDYEEQNEKSHVISDFIYQAKTNKVIKMISDGSEERQFIHISDVCSALRHSFSLSKGNVYDLSPNNWVKIYDIAEKIASTFNAEVVRSNKKSNTVKTVLPNPLPNWNPLISFEKGLDNILSENKGN